MDYDTGHARYCLDATAARLGIDKSTVKRHAKYLRELGLLAWVQVGSRTNVRAALGLKGYAATATVYAAVIPAYYDVAMGRTVVGTGYNARVVTDLRDRRSPVDNEGAALVDNPDAGACAPPSLTVVKESGSLQVESGFKDTSRKRASRSTAPISLPHQKDASNSHAPTARRSPAQVARDCWIAAQVRPRVTWTQTESIRRLAHALRPLIDQGLDAQTIVAELGSWWLDWRPARPAAYIRAQLAERARLEAVRAATVDSRDNAEWMAMVDRKAADVASLEALLAPTLERTDADRREAQEYGWQNIAAMAEVARHYEDDPDDAVDLYGLTLCARAVRMTTSSAVRF
jgi:hypothetical protein